jgi:hypothetical protein
VEEVLLAVLAAQESKTAIHHQSLDRSVLRHVCRQLLRKNIPDPLAFSGRAMTGLTAPKMKHIMGGATAKNRGRVAG